MKPPNIIRLIIISPSNTFKYQNFIYTVRIKLVKSRKCTTKRVPLLMILGSPPLHWPCRTHCLDAAEKTSEAELQNGLYVAKCSESLSLFLPLSFSRSVSLHACIYIYISVCVCNI